MSVAAKTPQGMGIDRRASAMRLTSFDWSAASAAEGEIVLNGTPCMAAMSRAMSRFTQDQSIEELNHSMKTSDSGLALSSSDIASFAISRESL